MGNLGTSKYCYIDMTTWLVRTDSQCVYFPRTFRIEINRHFDLSAYPYSYTRCIWYHMIAYVYYYMDVSFGHLDVSLSQSCRSQDKAAYDLLELNALGYATPTWQWEDFINGDTSSHHPLEIVIFPQISQLLGEHNLSKPPFGKIPSGKVTNLALEKTSLFSRENPLFLHFQ